ncbi:M12 family metallopeptidase [Flavobacterium chungangensis]|uniref:M12 family metallopeptidase n=1 Tax=Flavobacterium chungangensis TaxID=2708132 RepID=A0ABV8ZIL9_9FLAO
MISKPNAAIINWRWQAGQTIKIKFLDGEIAWQEKVKSIANEWTRYANLKFEYVGINEYADIRIGFLLTGENNNYGAWSELGAQTAYIPQSKQTMRLGSLTGPEDSIRRTILHEFGHALGLFHETTNPAANIQWDLPKAYKYYSLQFTKEQVDLFIINKENTDDYSEYDPLSIMHYYIPASITTNGVGVYEQTVLSQIDKESINKWYPFPFVSVMESGQSCNDLRWKDRIQSNNKRYSLEFTPGFLRIIDLVEKTTIWEVGNIQYPRKAFCYFESNGNIILKGARYIVAPVETIWTSNTSEYPGATLHLQDDGDLQLIYNGAVKWSSKNGKV